MELEKSPQKLGISFVSAVAEAAYRLRRLAEPRPVGDRVKAAIVRAASRSGLPVNRVENLWYGDAKLVRAEEMDAIRRADLARQKQEDSAREQIKSLGSLFAGIAAHLLETDPEFHGESIAALVDAARALGAADSAVAKAAGLTEERK